MANLNRATIIGNCGKDADVRYTTSGTAKAEFTVAVNSRVKKGEEWGDETEWFNVVLWGKTAENLSQYLTKGKPVYVEGRLATRSWDDNEGRKHYRTELIANDIQLLGSKPREQDGSEPWE